MDLTPPLAPSDSNAIRVGLSEPVNVYLARLADQQTRFLAAWTDANRSLHPSSGKVAKLASIHVRLTQEFLDAQRAIVRRRAETDAVIATIAADTASESAALLDAARSGAAIAVGTSFPPPAATADGSAMLMSAPVPSTLTNPDLAALTPPCPMGQAVRLAAPGIDDGCLAQLIDGLFESSEPDGVAVRREMRELLDGWWSAENSEAQAAIDDAHARAAMHLHLAQVEADELARFAPPSPRSLEQPIYTPRSSTALPAPFVSALDGTDHEHLDHVLAHLLDSLGPEKTGAADGSAKNEPGTATWDPALTPRLPDLEPSPPDSLNDRTAAPQEAFDRFWGTFSAPGSRWWFFPQLLLPAVTVIAVLALVLAVIG